MGKCKKILKCNRNIPVFRSILITLLNEIKGALKSDGRFRCEAALMLSHAAEIYLRHHTSLKTIL